MEKSYNIGSPSNKRDMKNPHGLRFFAFPAQKDKVDADVEVRQARKVRELKGAMDELKKKLKALGDVHCFTLREMLRDDHMLQFSIEVDSFFHSDSESKLKIGAGGVLEANAPGENDSDSIASVHLDAEAVKNASSEIVELLTTPEAQQHTGAVYTAVRHLLCHATRIERQSWKCSIIGTGVQKQDWDWRRALQKDHSDRQKLTCVLYQLVLISMSNGSTMECSPSLF